jgi:hypothetical protein
MTIGGNHAKIAIQKGVYTMKWLMEVCVFGSILICMASAQEPPKPALQKGVSVQMPVANHAVEMRAADEPNATVIAITAGGKVFAGAEPVELGRLSKLSTETVYVKADSRVPFQTVLTSPGRFTWQVGGTACCISRKRERGEVCIAVWDKGDRIPVRTAD